MDGTSEAECCDARAACSDICVAGSRLIDGSESVLCAGAECHSESDQSECCADNVCTVPDSVDDCSAIGSAGTAPGDDCTADARCSYNDGDTAATCTLPQATVDACAAITDESTCNDHESCTYDAGECGTTTQASACVAEDANGEGACEALTGCTWDDATSDDVCAVSYTHLTLPTILRV